MPSTEYKFQLGEEARKYAEEMLHETEETRNAGMDEIQKWLQENPKLHARMDYESILPFLRNCKFNVERTKAKLKNYYEMRSQVPEWFANRNPLLPEIQELVRLGVFVPLKTLQDNKLIVIIRTGAHDPKRHSQNNVFKTGKMILDIAAKENELCQLYGVIAIFDMSNVTLGHALQLKPHIIKKAVHAWQNYHCSPKQLEFINAPLHINVVLNIFKSFMSEKLKSRINIHFNGLGNLHEFLDIQILPSEYGGTNGNIQELCEYWSNKLTEYKDWFQTDEQFKAEI